MKYVKDNLTLVICGAVVVLVLVFAFAPIPFAAPSLKASLQEQMDERYGHTKSIKTSANTPLVLPGWEPAKGIPPRVWVDAKTRMIDGITRQQTEVENAARNFNQVNRVNGKVPLLPVPNNIDPARITGTPIDGYLPKVTRDAFPFKVVYGNQFGLWSGMLATGKLLSADADATIPPNAARLKEEYDARKKQLEAAAPPGMGGVGMGARPEQSQEQKELWDHQKRAVMKRATELRMYVEPSAFQVRQWFYGSEPPNDQQIFEGFVDSWFQSDVVKAIAVINNQALASVNDKNVGKAPIKRLTRIIVGNAARTRQLGTATPGAVAPGGQAGDPGPLFFTSSNANASAGGAGVGYGTPVPVNPGGGGGDVAAAAVAATPNAIDHALGMTGRSAGEQYDVVYMSVVMDIDPAYLLKFMDQFYRQNMGYTITGFQTKAVDPLDRASNGYLYGDGQVLEVELQIEGILFRSWTVPLMPQDTKRMLNIAAPN